MTDNINAVLVLSDIYKPTWNINYFKVYIPMSLIKPLRKLRRDVSLWDFVAMRKVCFLIAKNFKPLEQSRSVHPIARIGARVVTFLHLGRFSASRSKRVDSAVRVRACVGRERAFIPEKRRGQGRTNGRNEGSRRKGDV